VGVRINLAFGARRKPASRPSGSVRRVEILSGAQFVGSLLWRWDVVGAASLLLYGSGVGAMYGGQARIALALYAMSVVWLSAKTLTWEETKLHKARGVVSFLIVLFSAIVVSVSFEWINYTIPGELLKQESPLHYTFVAPLFPPNYSKLSLPASPPPPPSSSPPSNQQSSQEKPSIPKAPLEIVAFNSSQKITIANNGPISVYVIRLLVNTEVESKSFGLDFELEPGKLNSIQIADGLHNVRTLGKLADTWGEHLAKVETQYKNCWQLTYFSPSDAEFKQIEDHYLSEGTIFPYEETSGIIYYRVIGLPETKEQKVSIFVTVTLDKDKCP
jgi:hypothetical protein